MAGKNSYQSGLEINPQVVQLIEHSPIAMMVSAQDGQLLFVNQAMIFLLGYEQYEIDAPTFIARYQNELFLSRQQRQMALEDTTSCVHGCITLQHQSGKQVSLQQVCQLQSDASEDRYYFVSSLLDSSEKAEQSESLQLASLVFEASSEGMMVTDENGVILDVNKAFCDITGYRRQEVFGRNASILSSGQQDALFYRLMWRSIHASGQWKGEIWNRRKNGEVFPAMFSINTVFEENGEVNKRVALFSDLTQIKAREKQIFQLAYYDSITGLPNRELFMDRLNQIVSLKKSRQQGVALMLLDLDGFKEVNDTLGHDAGDQLLAITAERLEQCVDLDDVVARLGGDEFTVIVRHIDRIEKIAQQILQALSKTIVLGDDRIYISCSIGITHFPQDAEQVSDLLRNADQAMYAVKQSGRNDFSYFTKAMQQKALQRLNAINDLRVAIKQQQFVLYYQPIVDLKSGIVSKAEALVRWQHPVKGLISPDEFIPVAEETGLINEIGKWIILEALQQVYLWRETYHPNFEVSVNASPLQFKTDDNLAQNWIDLVDKLGLPGNALSVEITENLLMEFSDRVDRKMAQFKAANIQISLDDFGTGYASLSYLKRFDIDFLKIDKSYVQSMRQDKSVQVMCESIILMAHKLGILVIAEGIENKDQLAVLTNMGCDYGQGYLFAQPLAADGFEALLARKKLL